MPKVEVKVENDVCLLKQDKGPCKAIIKSFSFNSETKKCEPFNYGGCGGNENNFASEAECAKKCNHRMTNESVDKVDKCSQPKVIGPCYAIHKKFFYNSASKSCEEFNYGLYWI